MLARPSISIQRLNAAMRASSPPYMKIPLDDPSLLKGSTDARPVVLKYYPKETPYAPSPRLLSKLFQEPALFFLTHVDQGPIGLYVHYSLDALQDGALRTVEAVRIEVARQNRELEAWTSDRTLPHFDRVRSLLARLPDATKNDQQRIFEEFEFFKDAVPAIIAQMDDRRPLAFREIALQNHMPDAFESLRHYGPELVVDALDAILNQVTGYGSTIAPLTGNVGMPSPRGEPMPPT